MSSSNPPDTADAAALVTLRVRTGWTVVGAAKVAGIGLACFVAQWVSVRLWVAPAKVSTVWIPGGLMLAIALLTERRRWPIVIAAAAGGTSLLFVTLRLVDPAGALLLGLLAGLQTIGLAAVLHAVLPCPSRLTTLRDWLKFLVVASGGALVASILFFAGVWATAIRPPSILVWRTFALAALLGYLLMTPTTVLLVREAKYFSHADSQRRAEACLLGLLLALASGLVLTGTTSRAATWTAFLVTLPPLLLWSTLRFGPLGASASLLLVVVSSTWSTANGLGPFAGASAADNTLSLQLLMLAVALPLLGLAIVLGEQTRIAAALRSSEARLLALTRELVHAREEEATRIGRELHDDVGQRLALVSIGLSRLRQAQAPGAAGAAPDIRQLQEQATAVAQSLREISHRLHPVTLEQVGLAMALELKCEEVQRAAGVNLRMANHGDSSTVPRDVALCVFRVAQEALNNVVRHSGAHTVALMLRRDGDELSLAVADDGRGFASSTPGFAFGLGLHSAAERVASVGGTLAIESAPGAGTTVRVAIPIRESDGASPAGHPRG